MILPTEPTPASALADEAEALAQKATLGPWFARGDGHILGPDEAFARVIVALFPSEMRETADFIAWCREGVPQLVAHLRRLEAEAREWDDAV